MAREEPPNLKSDDCVWALIQGDLSDCVALLGSPYLLGLSLLCFVLLGGEIGAPAPPAH